MQPFAVVLALAALSSVAATTPISSVPRVTSLGPKTVPGAVIVELAPGAALPGKRAADPHADFFDALEKRVANAFTTRQKFASSLFTGVSLQLHSDADVQLLGSIPNVVNVRPVRLFPLPAVRDFHVPTGPRDPAIPPDGQSSHVMTGVDKAHAAGITGKGIKIGIIDSGLDYTNPALGGAFGPGNKVAGGTDLVGDAYDGTNTPVPDADPRDTCNGHGTHVAGIIGANPGNLFNISGVAYDASLFSYRVFGCMGSTADDVLTQALILGFEQGMDIMTMSLGAADGWSESTVAVLSSRIVDAGRVVTIAAGNDGQFGAFFTSEPGTGIDVISVASVDNIDTVFPSLTTSIAHAPIPYEFLINSIFPVPLNGSFPVYATSNDTTVVDDACSPLPASTPDLSKFATVVHRGTCSFVQKLTNLAAFNASVVIIYNNGGSFGPISTGTFANVVLIQDADGDFLVQQFAAGVPIAVSFPQTNFVAQVPNTVTGGLVSSFTSFGPSYDMFFKPAVAAPGGNIVSTFPVNLGSFAMESGTSMATPFTAGCAALLLQTKGRGIARGVRTLLQTTSTNVPSALTEPAPPQTLAQQGAGLVNVFNALTFTTTVSPGELLLNDTAHFRGTHLITIHNGGRKAVTYALSHVPALTAIALVPGTPLAADFPVPQTTDAASVRLSQSKVTVFPGASAVVAVTIAPPKSVAAATLPVFSGWIQVAGGGETLKVSYLGLAAALKAAQVVDNSDVFFGIETPVTLDSSGNVQTAQVNYTLQGADAPTILFRLAMGTPALKIDLVDAGIKIATNLKRDGGFLSWWWPGIFKPKGGTFSQVKLVGNIIEADFIPRDTDDPTTGFESVLLPPTFANNTAIPPGTYRALMRALKITGDPANEADYEVYLSPPFGVTAA